MGSIDGRWTIVTLATMLDNALISNGPSTCIQIADTAEASASDLVEVGIAS